MVRCLFILLDSRGLKVVERATSSSMHRDWSPEAYEAYLLNAAEAETEE